MYRLSPAYYNAKYDPFPRTNGELFAAKQSFRSKQYRKAILFLTSAIDYVFEEGKKNTIQASSGSGQKRSLLALTLPGLAKLSTVYQWRAYCYLLVKDDQAALDDYSQLMTLPHKQSSNLYNRGVALIRLGRNEAGLDSIRESHLLQADSLSVQERRTLYDAKSSLDPTILEVNKVADYIGKALAPLDRLIEDATNDKKFLRIEIALTKTKKALSLCDELEHKSFSKNSGDEQNYRISMAMAFRNRRTVLHEARALLFLQLEQHKSALAEINQAIALDRSDPRFLFTRSRIYEVAGNEKLAMADQRVATKIAKGEPELMTVEIYQPIAPESLTADDR
jgi:tetratricopeptide (TPR) repeat protein